MNITIIGAGAMGSLFGYFLARSGQTVFLMDIWEDHVNAINSRGIEIESDGKIYQMDIPASTTLTKPQTSDLVIIFVKSTQTEQAAVQALTCLKDNGLVLTLQNGMGNADKIAQVILPDKVIAGTTAHGATLLGPGRIRHAGVGPTLIGMWSGKNMAELETIKNIFCSAGIDTTIEPNIHLIIWKKLVINVGINAITALTGIKNGKIMDAPPTRDLVRTAVKEACDVALAHGIKLPDDMAEQVFAIATATGTNRSSMGQDVDHQRPTEIDSINGAIVNLAEKKGLSVPINRTLTALIQTLQLNYT